MADIKVRDVMTKDVITLAPGDTIQQGAQTLACNGISGAPVVDADQIVGVVSEADLIEAVMPENVEPGRSVLQTLGDIVTGRPRDDTVIISDVMTPHVVTIEPEQSIWKAAHEIESRAVKRLPVVDEDNRLVGVISRADIVKAMAYDDARITDGVRDAIAILGPEVIDDLEVIAKDGVVTLAGIADRRSTHELAVRLTARSPGVVKIIDNMTHEIDDDAPKVPAATDVFAPSEP
jgi:CBS domain-containing protein